MLRGSVVWWNASLPARFGVDCKACLHPEEARGERRAPPALRSFIGPLGRGASLAARLVSRRALISVQPVVAGLELELAGLRRIGRAFPAEPAVQHGVRRGDRAFDLTVAHQLSPKPEYSTPSSRT